MLLNYFKTTLRNLRRNKSYTLINVAGLSLGTVCALIIFAIIRFEYSFDTYHDEPESIYRVVGENNRFGEINHEYGVPYPMPQALRIDFPEFENLTIVDQNFGNPVVAVEDARGVVTRYREEHVAAVEPDYFKIFKHEWLLGNPEAALQEPNAVVLSEDIAQKYFGAENPIGKQLNYDNQTDLQVTGVFKKPPQNTDMPFNILTRFQFDEEQHSNWGSISTSVQCYVRLSSHVQPHEVESRFDAFLAKHRDQEAADRFDYRLQPLSELHFDARYETYNTVVTKQTLFSLALIGVALLLAACINFINLNTAIAVRRSKEVGVRKVLGGTRGKLISQFLTETAVISFAALALSIALAELAARQLQPLLGYDLPLSPLGDPWFAGFLVILLVVVTLGAGYYPAIHVSRFSPVQALRNKLSSRYSEGLSLRKGLVIVQFVIAQVLILCTFIIASQMRYLQSADLGIDKEAVVEVELPVNDLDRLERFKHNLLQESVIVDVTYSNSGSASSNVWDTSFKLKDGEEIIENNTHIKFIDEDFLATYGLQLIAGRPFTSTDTTKAILVNEAFVQTVGYSDNYDQVIGKYLRTWGMEMPITGVVKNFHTTSLHDDIPPVIMVLANRYYLSGIKIQAQQVTSAINAIETAWDKSFPEYVFDYRFLDDAIAEFYENEQRTARLMNIFTAIAIVISCLGLFGLVSYMANQRMKEIGIRKVLGASFAHILGMFSREFALLLIVAFAVATPLAYLLMQKWLSDFAYRIQLQPFLFLGALTASILVALLTVAFKSVRAALANPVDSLRSE